MSLPAHQTSQAERENESARHRLSNPVANSAKGQSFKGGTHEIVILIFDFAFDRWTTPSKASDMTSFACLPSGWQRGRSDSQKSVQVCECVPKKKTFCEKIKKTLCERRVRTDE